MLLARQLVAESQPFVPAPCPESPKSPFSPRSSVAIEPENLPWCKPVIDNSAARHVLPSSASTAATRPGTARRIPSDAKPQPPDRTFRRDGSDPRETLAPAATAPCRPRESR